MPKKRGRPKNPFKKTPLQKLYEYKKKHPNTAKTAWR